MSWLGSRWQRAFGFIAVLQLAWAASAASPSEIVQSQSRTNPPARHWAFVPPIAAPPPVTAGSRATHPIDAFIEARWRALGIEPAPLAPRHELLRRVTFDLTGLPPTPEETAAFLADDSPTAYERVVDRLLASPAFGVRWAQHWLDLAHYADSNGFELDADRPDAWRYRDWVVQAFNTDLPFDRFVTLQVAGDEVAPGNPAALIAAGFARSGPREVVGGNIDPEVRRQDELTAATSTVGSVFLGLTLGCARCHDHKFDPLPSADYYRLQAFFAGAELVEVPLHSADEKGAFERETARIQALIKPIADAKTKLEQPHRERLLSAKEAALTPHEREIRSKPKDQRTPEEVRLFEGLSAALKVTWEDIAEEVARHPADHAAREQLKQRIHELELQLPRPPAHAMTLAEGRAPLPETRQLRRGDVKQKGAPVSPRPPEVLLASFRSREPFHVPETPIDATHSGRRLALARWLTDPGHPLTARVIVNRLWQHHFGRGLVGTTSDFGARGERPSHPELLDWLALELVRQGWHLKALHRLMVTSRAYQLASQVGPDAIPAVDPENRTWWRMHRRRMEAEGLRDALLAAAGELNLRASGPGVRVPLEPEVRALIFTEAEVVDLWPVDPDRTEHKRRGLFLHRKRNVHYPLFDAFDAPDAQSPCPVRSVSTHAPQALVLINSGFAQDTARGFARNLLKAQADEVARLNEAFERCYARQPTRTELELSQEFLRTAPGTEFERWTDLALALLNSNEFIYVP